MSEQAERWTTDYVDVFDASGAKVCRLARCSKDGSLIAASPTMLAELKKLAAHPEQSPDWDGIHAAIRLAGSEDRQ